MIKIISDKLVRIKIIDTFVTEITTMFSKTTEYAIKAMIYIATYGKIDNKINLGEVATAIESPTAFTAKILQQLKKSGLLSSTLGAKGGFWVEPNQQINIQDVVNVFEDENNYNKCVLGLKVCSSTNPCPMHEKYASIKKDLKNALEKTYINEFSNSIINQKMTLK